MKQSNYNLYSLQKRILVSLLLISFVFCILFLRLGIVQLVNGNWLQQKATEQWTRSLPLIAERGKIYDKNGAVLAISYSSYSLYSRAKEIKNASTVAEKLSEILQIPFSEIFKKITDKSVSERLISLQVDNEKAKKIFSFDFDGIYLTENTKRNYPFGDLLTQVLGFCTIDGIGQSGLESYFNENLSGKNGISLVQSDLVGIGIDNTLDYFIPAINGQNLVLTIDSNLQIIIEQVLIEIMQEQKAKQANAILMNAKTGEILAFGSKPSFDLNDIPRNNPTELMSNIKNNMVVDVYEPGSTFKIITMSIALELGVAHLQDRFYCPGYCIVNGEKIKCWKAIGHGSQTLAEGLANSCNCVFTELACRIGLERFYEYLDIFGYGKKTGIEISGESSGILMNIPSVKTVDLARMGFGQAVAVTELQQILAIASAVNGGNLLKPILIKKITDNNGNILKEEEPEQIKKTISSETSKLINEMLDLTVSKQTGKYSFVPGYAVGGKTGTTQKYENGKISGTYISSFVGTYPVNDPNWILLIVVDEPGAGAYYGSIVASPYAKIIFSKLFEYYNIPPDDKNSFNKTEEYVEMPNLIGESLTKAINLLQEIGISYEIDGEGNLISWQTPNPNVSIKKNSTVLIKTN